MNNILKTTTRLGSFILRNRNKVLIGVGTIALAGVVGGVLSHFKTRRQWASARAKKKILPEKLSNAGIHGHQKEIFKAPAMAPENLIKH